MGISACAGIVSIDTVKNQFIPVLQTLSQDKVANIRMNAAKTLSVVYTVVYNARAHTSKREAADDIACMLRALSSDSDGDVKFYAKQSSLFTTTQ